MAPIVMIIHSKQGGILSFYNPPEEFTKKIKEAAK
jgi:hypothetical protein